MGDARAINLRESEGHMEIVRMPRVDGDALSRRAGPKHRGSANRVTAPMGNRSMLCLRSATRLRLVRG
jgi:hypothetical protein